MALALTFLNAAVLPCPSEYAETASGDLHSGESPHHAGASALEPVHHDGPHPTPRSDAHAHRTSANESVASLKLGAPCQCGCAGPKNDGNRSASPRLEVALADMLPRRARVPTPAWGSDLSSTRADENWRAPDPVPI